MTLQELSNYIILVSAVILAVTNIYKFFKKPVDTLSEQAKKAEKERVMVTINEVVPDMLNNCKQELKDEVRVEIKNSISQMQNELSGKLDEIKSINLDQNSELQAVVKSQVDMMRSRLSAIYYKYLPYEAIRTTDKKLFTSLYEDYKSLNGNSWMKEVNTTVSNWRVVSDDYNFKKEET